MFASTAVARRIEGAEAAVSADLARAVAARGRVAGAFARDAAGGVAVFTGVEAPLTKVIGVGFGVQPVPPDLLAIEEAFEAVGAPVRYEIASLADPAWLSALTSRGYVLRGFENVLGRRLAHRPGAAAAAAGRENITIQRTTDLAAWRHVLISGFEAPDAGVVSAPGEPVCREALEQVFEDMTGGETFWPYTARVESVVAGAAGLRLQDGIAQLCGAATLPAYRRRGIQTRLLEVRLQEAAAAGADLAVITTEPGSRSQENAQRAGFTLLYARAVLVRDPRLSASAG